MKVTVPIYGEEFKKVLQNFVTLRVTAQDTPDLTVKVSPGTLWYYTSTGTKFIEFPGDTIDIFL